MATNIIDQALATQLANIEINSGKTLAQWTKIINDSGFEKHGELVNFLKAKHGFTHGNANTLVHVAKKSHAGASEDKDDLVEEQYKGKEELRAWYETLMKEISKFGDDIEVSPKKAYVSLRRKKQFAIIQPSTKTRLDVGLNIKGVPAGGIAESSGSWNAMCTHRIKVEEKGILNSELFSLIKKAYEQAG
jgi:predicted transport protein